MKVLVLANCRNPALYGATRMVFDTIRVGFPKAEITVWTWGFNTVETIRLCRKVEANHILCSYEHPKWIADQIIGHLPNDEPFFLCDTDVVFWDNVEDQAVWADDALAGRFIPKFYDEFTKCITMPRLHTSLLYVNPPALRTALKAYHAKYPNTVYDPTANLFMPLRVPSTCGSSRFHDGGCLLYLAVGGREFDENMLNRYDHLHCGCTSDIVEPHLTLGANMTANNLALIDNPAAAKGIWKQQYDYYARFATRD